MKRISHFCCLTTCLLVLAGCGMIDLAYNNAPNIVASKFDDAFDLNDAQNDQLDSRLDQFFEWHRKEELARYQQLLEHTALAVSVGITVD